MACLWNAVSCCDRITQVRICSISSGTLILSNKIESVCSTNGIRTAYRILVIEPSGKNVIELQHKVRSTLNIEILKQLTPQHGCLFIICTKWLHTRKVVSTLHMVRWAGLIAGRGKELHTAVQLPAGQDSSLRHEIQTGSGTHPASFPMGIGALQPGVRRLACEADHAPPSAEVKN
jgi:hypothetical protein